MLIRCRSVVVIWKGSLPGVVAVVNYWLISDVHSYGHVNAAAYIVGAIEFGCDRYVSSVYSVQYDRWLLLIESC